MQTTSVNPREEHREFWANNLTLPIDDPFWDKHRPGDQWNCKCWLEQTDAPRTALEDMPDSADIPEPKAGLRGNTAKTKEISSQDHPHFPHSCATCHLNTDGKVHGIKGKKNPKNSDVLKGNCHLCEMSKKAEERIDDLVERNKKDAAALIEWGKETMPLIEIARKKSGEILTAKRFETTIDNMKVIINIKSYNEFLSKNYGDPLFSEKIKLAKTLHLKGVLDNFKKVNIEDSKHHKDAVFYVYEGDIGSYKANIKVKVNLDINVIWAFRIWEK